MQEQSARRSRHVHEESARELRLENAELRSELHEKRVESKSLNKGEPSQMPATH